MHTRKIRLSIRVLVIGFLATQHVAAEQAANDRVFRAGAAAVDITPKTLPVIVSGGFQERTADKVNDTLAARALVLDDGDTRLVIVVVDTLVMSRALVDEIKALAEAKTGIPTDRMLISATHTHSAPSLMACLGSRADEVYLQGFAEKVAQAVELAAQRLQPARVGWAVVQDDKHNHCRRWIFRPDRMPTDPFGNRNVRAHMHPGYQSANHVGPSGPADTDLSLLSLQTKDGQPLAVLANYALHYFGSEPVSADFCGRFGKTFARLIGADQSEPEFVGIMSQGTSGDSMWMDYSQPARQLSLQQFTDEVAHVALQAYEKIEYRNWVPLKMSQTLLRLGRRTPDAARLAWAREVVASIGDRLPRTQPEIYAREQIYLHETPEVELKLQALRIGDLGIACFPCEVFGITGLKIKRQSPIPTTFNVELANGEEGYIPPPEQHALGGYTTWPARTAALEMQAEPKIVAALLELLNQIADRPQAKPEVSPGGYAAAILAAKPLAYWRFNEMEGRVAQDASGHAAGEFEPGVALFLPGVAGEGFTGDWRGNRAVHFAGGRMKSNDLPLKDVYSIEFWFWNGLPDDARPVTGYLWERHDGTGRRNERLGIGGTQPAESRGRLFLADDDQPGSFQRGNTVLQPKTWYHVAVTCDGRQLRVYLNGQAEPEIVAAARPTSSTGPVSLFVGGAADGQFTWEGKIDEVAVFDRALKSAEIAEHVFAAGAKGKD